MSGDPAAWASMVGWLSRALTFGGAMVVRRCAAPRRSPTRLLDDRRLSSSMWWGSGAALVGRRRRAVVAGVTGVGTAAARARSRCSASSSRRAAPAHSTRFGSALALVAVVAVSVAGRARLRRIARDGRVLAHVLAERPRLDRVAAGLTVTVDAIHLVAAASWAGGPAWRWCAVIAAWRTRPRSCRRFSDVAAVALVARGGHRRSVVAGARRLVGQLLAHRRTGAC